MMEQNDYKELFNHKGIKNTKQRNIVYNVLKHGDSPITADQLFIKVKELDNSISFSTIYRILDMFINKDMVLKTFPYHPNYQRIHRLLK